MQTQTTTPPQEEPTQEATPWQERLYQALQTAFPDAVYHQITYKEQTDNNVVAFTSDDQQYFISWYPLAPDEVQYMNDTKNNYEPVSGEH